MTTIDTMNLPRLDLIQLDVEGMEDDVLEGAEQTIARCQPMLYLETSHVVHNPVLAARLERWGYSAWWHLAPMYNPHNHRGDTENAWPDQVSISWLCAPPGVDLSRVGLTRVTDPMVHGGLQFVQTP